MSSLAVDLRAARETAPGTWLRATALAGSVGTLLAAASGLDGLGSAHRVVAALGAPPLVALVVAAWGVYRRLLPAGTAALVLFLAAGVLTVPAVHLTLAALACSAACISAVEAFHGETVGRGAWRDYVTATKPRIMSLLLLTGAGGMVVGRGAVPPAGRALATIVGLALACGGASALNHLLDRDIDRLMGKRTESRPVAAGRLSPAQALEFGLALSAFSFVLLASVVNLASAALALLGNLFYVCVYTGWLKRSTPQNIVIGGAAGAVPPLVGFAAANGHLTLTALWLFLIVFLWTPPHFWALALLLKDHYAAASVPMLPVTRGERSTRRQIVAYALALAAITLVPAVLRTFGPVYLAAALLLNLSFLALAVDLALRPTRRRAALVFHASLLYLALLFAAAAVDALV